MSKIVPPELSGEQSPPPRPPQTSPVSEAAFEQGGLLDKDRDRKPPKGD